MIKHIILQPSGKRIEVKEGLTLLDILINNGIQIEAVCGGNGACGKCKVKIMEKNNVSSITEIEKNNFSENELKEGFRLACQVKILDSVTVKILEESYLKKQRILIEDSGIKVKLNPAVKRFLLKIPKPTLENPMADFERILTTFNKSDFGDIDIDHDILKGLPEVLRKNEEVFFTVFNKHIIHILPGKKKKFYGAAVDIGTTTMVLYLIDLSNGHIVNIVSAMNPQIPYGEDIISRITFCMKNGPQKLQGLVIDKINYMIKQACNTANVNTDDVFELSIVGNTAMHHLFLGFNSKYLIFSPYVPVIRRSINLKAKELEININPCGNVYVLPIVAGFVGGDHIGFILSAGIYKSEKIILGIDIGTNGEIILGNKKKMICCSCAAGPALEGAGIQLKELK